MIRVSISAAARVPHAVAEGIHVVAPHLRSRYTVHAVAVTIMSVGYHIHDRERGIVEWLATHGPHLIAFLADMGLKPVSELLTGIGLAPYLDGSTKRVFDALKPEEKK